MYQIHVFILPHFVEFRCTYKYKVAYVFILKTRNGIIKKLIILVTAVINNFAFRYNPSLRTIFRILCQSCYVVHKRRKAESANIYTRYKVSFVY